MMSIHFPQAVVSLPGRSIPPSRTEQAGKWVQAALPGSGNKLSRTLGTVRFGATASTVGKPSSQQHWFSNPAAWMKQVRWSIQQGCARFIAFVKWTTLMGAGMLGFWLVPKVFQRYLEGRFLLGPNTVISPTTQKDALLRAKIQEGNFEMGQYQDELRRSGLGFDAKQDNIRLNYWYIQGKVGQPCIIYSHGRGTHIGQQEGLLKGFMDRGYGVLTYEYPGRSQGDGIATEQRLYKASLSASLHASRKLQIPIPKQVIMGNSLGSIVAAKTVNYLDALGLGERPKALIMVSSFPNLQEAFLSYRSRLGIIGNVWNENNITVKLDARAALQKNKNVPVLLLQGGRDRSTPYSMAEAMKQGLPQENQATSKVIKMPLCKHKLREADFPVIVQETDAFLQGLSPVLSPKKVGA